MMGQAKAAFFEKKAAEKRLNAGSALPERARPTGTFPKDKKFFGSFFQKRTACL